MAFTRYYPLTVLVPAGTAIAAPLAVRVPLETNHLDRIEVDVPDGHDRFTGVRVVANGTVVVPFALDGWLVANSHYFTIPFDDDITVGDLLVQAYNTDVFDHTFYLRFVVSNATVAITAGVVSAQVPGTVAPSAAEAVATLAVTPDQLAVAPVPPPPEPSLIVPPAPGQGVP